MSDTTPNQQVHVDLKVLTQSCPVCGKPAIKVGSYNDISKQNLNSNGRTAYTEEVGYECGAKLQLVRNTTYIEDKKLTFTDNLHVNVPCPDQGKALLQQIQGING